MFQLSQPQLRSKEVWQKEAISLHAVLVLVIIIKCLSSKLDPLHWEALRFPRRYVPGVERV